MKAGKRLAVFGDGIDKIFGQGFVADAEPVFAQIVRSVSGCVVPILEMILVPVQMDEIGQDPRRGVDIGIAGLAQFQGGFFTFEREAVEVVVIGSLGPGQVGGGFEVAAHAPGEAESR